MKNRILYIFIGLCLLISTNYGQEKNAVFPDGTTVIFENKVASSLTAKAGAKVRVINVLSPSGRTNIVHRVFVDGENKSHFGYDLEVKNGAEKGKYTLAFKPLSIILFSNATENKILPKFPEPMQINEGDRVSVDLLENPKTGEKIADLIKVVQGAPRNEPNRTGIPEVLVFPDNATVRTISRMSADSPTAAPKDFSIDEIGMQFADAAVLVNGNLVAEKKIAFGANVYFYLKGKGRFILSPVPREGYDFQKNGVIDGRRVSFEMGGDKYEITSLIPIICTGGKWNLWVLYEPGYRPNAEVESEFGGGTMESLIRK